MDLVEPSPISFKTIQDTILKNSEKAVFSFLLDGQIENGIFVDDTNKTFCVHTNPQGNAFACILEENNIICVVLKSQDGIEEVINGNSLQKNGTIDLDAEGDRWEGDCYNGMAFGYGTLWNKDNNRSYQGFQFGENHFGYGIKFFSPVVKEYVGYWCAGKRHGKGVLYDGKENVIYDGIWMNNETPISEIHLKPKKDLMQLTNQLEEIELGNFCCKNNMNFCLISLPKLKKVKIGKGCFTDSDANRYEFYRHATEEEEKRFGKVCFRSCPLLSYIQLIPTIFNNMLSCEFSDLPSLEMLIIRDHSFIKCQTMYIGKLDLSSLVTLNINHSFRFLKKAVIEKLPKLIEMVLNSGIHGDVPDDDYDDEFIEYPNELIIKDLPSFQNLKADNGDLFNGFGIIKVENVANFECNAYYAFNHCYNYEVINADSFKDLIEEKASHLYLHYSKPFDINSLSTSITSLNIARLTGNEPSFTSLTIANFPELVDISIDRYSFLYVRYFTIEDCNKLQHFSTKDNTLSISIFESSEACFSIHRCQQLETVYFAPYSCSSYRHFSISDCPSLQSLEFSRHSFGYATEFILKDLPMLKKVVLDDSNFYDSEITQLENLPSLESFLIGYGSLWGGNTNNKEDFCSRVIMKNLPNLKTMRGLADGCFNNVECFELENIPSLEEIEFYGGLRYVREVKATNADVLRDYIEKNKNRGY